MDELAGIGMVTDVGTTYTHLRTGPVAAQRQVGPGIIVDVDDDDYVIGIETIGDVPFESAMMQVALAARVTADNWH
jgi:uncharacterized protein YuzE